MKQPNRKDRKPILHIVNMPEDLFHGLKTQAVQEKRYMRDLCIELLTDALKRRKTLKGV